MPFITVSIGDELVGGFVKEGITALDALRDLQLLFHVDAPCGGNGKCNKCMAEVNGEEKLLCQTLVTGDFVIRLINKQNSILTDIGEFGNDEYKMGQKRGLGAAIDIGTTTIAAYLYDLSSGTLIGTKGERNNQSIFGADVIARVKYCMDYSDGLATQSKVVRDQILRMLAALLPNGHTISEISMMVVSGNTVMEHFFAGLSPEAMVKAPFMPLFFFGNEMKGSIYDLTDLCKTDVFISPCVSGYVGGDITSGLMSVNADASERTILFVDVGTNGEMALGNKDEYLCCSTAAGPAFEGASISCGMNAEVGAVDRVDFSAGEFQYSVIGNQSPKGFCGSGLIDMLASLLEAGIVDETGRLLSASEVEIQYKNRIEGEGKTARFNLAEGVFLTADDIRKLQLAKAAIAAGIQTLLNYSETDIEDISTFYLAGGFGSYIRPDSAVKIGLFPEELKSKIKNTGNASGRGASIALLTDNGFQRLLNIKQMCKYIELSGMALFNQMYVDSMFF